MTQKSNPNNQKNFDTNEFIQHTIAEARKFLDETNENHQMTNGEIIGRVLAHYQTQAVAASQAIRDHLAEKYNLAAISATANALVDALRILAPQLALIKERIEAQPNQIKKFLLALGKQGWYMGPEIRINVMYEIKDLLEGEQFSKVDELMIYHHEHHIEEIEKSLSKNFPKREHLFAAAFNAHKAGQYELSIPVLLAQTDGICKEITKEEFFMGRDGKPKTAKYIDSLPQSDWEVSMLGPFTELLPINYSEKQRDSVSSFNLLNRHMVLHGESLDYGTRINSLRTISLINYIAHFLLPDSNP